MDQVPRSILILALGILLASAACAGGRNPVPTAAPAAPTRQPSSPTGAPRGSRGSMQLSGQVQGFLSILSVTCGGASTDVVVAIRGRVENTLYGVEISAPRAGSFVVGEAAASVRLSSQTPADATVSRWSAGADGIAGAGGVSLSPDGGSVDADLEGFAGTRGLVHLRGSWSCPA